MKEKQIDIDSQFKYDLAGLKCAIKATKLCKIVADYEVDGTYSLMYACEDENMSILDNILAHYLSNFYITRYKRYYLERHINFNAVDRIFEPAFLQAIVAFDVFTDREIALEADYTISRISVIPFLYFKISDLLQRWQTISHLTNDNVGCFDKTPAVMDLLAYLVKNQQNKTKMLEVCFTDYGIRIYNGAVLSFESESQTNSDVADMMAVLVKLCPQRLKVSSTNPNSNAEVVKHIFSDKVI